MKKIIHFGLLLILFPVLASAGAGPIGWASVNANGQDGTTGGAGGQVVTVNNMTDLFLYANSNDPYIIQIDGVITITPKGRHIAVRSNKTIVGITPDAGLTQGGFSVGTGVKNVIFQNLTISDTFVEGDWDGKEQDWDGIQIKGTCHHIWIDRCTFLRQGDGAVDITNGASYITIFYSKFGQNNKASLIGSSDSDTHTDKYKVTIHHSWFNETTQRHPRVRFGQVHLFNNYYYNMGGYGKAMGFANSNGYGVGIGVNAHIWSENNYFENVVNPTQFYDNPSQRGYLKDNGSFRVASGMMLTRADGINWDPSDHYQYTLDDAQTVKDIVMAQAGAGRIPTNLPYIAFTEGSVDLQIFPNPVCSNANLAFHIPQPGNVRIYIRDITGRTIRNIEDQYYMDGKHSISMDRSGLNAGIYILTLEINNNSVTRKIVVN